MIDRDRIPKELIQILENKLQGRNDQIIFPPPVFDAMKGADRFPVLNEQLNPYGKLAH